MDTFNVRMVRRKIKKAARVSGSHNPNDIQYTILNGKDKSTGQSDRFHQGLDDL